MARAIDGDKLVEDLRLIATCWSVSPFVSKEKHEGAADMLREVEREVKEAPTLTPPNEPLTQADLDSMDYDKAWIDYEDGTGEWALVCRGYIYSIDTLEGAGFDFVDYMRGERLEPHGYKVYRRPPDGEEKMR